MPKEDQLTKRRAVVANNVSHSKRRTKTRWSPNIQKATVEINGERKKLYVCTRCIRTQYKTAMKD